MTAETLQGEMDAYGRCRTAGHKVIEEGWRHLLPRTTLALQNTGHYSKSGRRISDAESFGESGAGDVSRLEHALGVLSLAAKASIPSRADAKAEIPIDALGYERDQVQWECIELLSVPEWRDPAFLRLALRGLTANQLAESLRLVGADAGLPLWLVAIGKLFLAALVLASPAAAAYALVAGTSGNLLGATAGMYLAAWGVSVGIEESKKAAGKNTGASISEQQYQAWLKYMYSVNSSDRANTIGAGAMEVLRMMVTRGISVPLVAFDLCAALRDCEAAKTSGTEICR